MEFVRNITNNVGVIFEGQYYWSDEPTYPEILFSKKLGRDPLTPEQKRVARINYACDLLQSFSNISQFLGINETLEDLIKQREAFGLINMSDELIYTKLLSDKSFAWLFHLTGNIRGDLEQLFKEESTKHQATEMFFASLVEQMKNLFHFPEFKEMFGERWHVRNYYMHPLPHGKNPLLLKDNDGKSADFCIDLNPSTDNGVSTLSKHLSQFVVYFPWLIKQKFPEVYEKLYSIVPSYT